MAAPSLDSFRDKEGNNLIHIYVSDLFPAIMPKMMKRRDVPSQHKPFLKSLRQDRQWLLDRKQLSELVTRGCNPNGVNAKGETPMRIVWERYKKTVEVDQGRGSGSAPPGKRERAAIALLRECGAESDIKGNQECLQVTWSILERMRQSGQTPPVMDPKAVMEMTPIRLMFMSDVKEQADIIKALIGGFKITQPPLNPILTFDILLTSGTLLHPDVMKSGILVSLLRVTHQMMIDRPEPARHFWEQRRAALTDLVRMYAGSADNDAIRAHDPATGSTALHYALRLEMEDIVNICFQHPKADDSATDMNGCTPLLLSLDKLKDPRLLTASRSAITIAKLLANQSRSVTLTDRHGLTPLLAVTTALATCGLKYKERQAYTMLSRHLPEGTKVPVGRESSAVGFCIEADQPGLLKELVDSRIPGLGLKEVDGEGITPLHTAGLLGRYECARVLITADTSLCNLQDRSGNTPLFYLVSSLKPGQTLDVLRNHQTAWDFSIKNNRYETVLDYYMVKATDDIHSGGIQDVLHSLVSASGIAPEAASIGNLRRDPKLFQSMSVATGKKVGKDEPMRNIRDLVHDLNDLHELFQFIADRSRSNIDAMTNGKTTAMICARHGLEDEVHYLVSMGEMNVNLQDPDGRTALHHAAMTGHVDCFQVITMVPDVNLNLQDRNGNSALFYVAENFSPMEVQRLVKQLPWNFTQVNYSGGSVYDHYLSGVPRPHDAVMSALKRACLGHGGKGTTLDEEARRKVWEAVKQQRMFIIDNFVDTQKFFNFLIQEKVMDSEYVRKLKSRVVTDAQMAEEVLDYLPKRGNNAYHAFIGALNQSEQEHIADRLEEAISGIRNSSHSRVPSQKSRSQSQTSPQVIHSPLRATRSSPPVDISGSPGPQDPDLLLRRPTVGQLANQLEGMIKRPNRNSLDRPSPVSPVENSYYSTSPEGNIRSREERGSASRVQRFSYLETTPKTTTPDDRDYPQVVHESAGRERGPPSYRSGSFKNMGAPPPYDGSRKNQPHPPLSRH